MISWLPSHYSSGASGGDLGCLQETHSIQRIFFSISLNLIHCYCNIRSVSAQLLFSHTYSLFSGALMFPLQLKIFCTNLKVTWWRLSKMLTNTDVVDSTSGKKNVLLYKIKAKDLQILFLLFCGGKKNPTNDIDFNLKGRKRCFLEDWKLTASSIPLNIHTFYLVNSECISVFVWKIKFCEFEVSPKEKHQINLD